MAWVGITMSTIIPAVKINTSNSASNTAFSHEKTQNITAKNPSFEGKNLITVGDGAKKTFEWLGQRSTPFNRGVIGLFAFATQPWIDLFNKDVDEETRKAAFLRTCAKIVVGTTTGILVRMGFIKAMSEFTKTTEELAGKAPKKWQQALIPSHIPLKKFEDMGRFVKKHRNVMGSFIAIFAMMLTDPPLTVFMTNFFNKKKQELEAKKAAQKEVSHE